MYKYIHTFQPPYEAHQNSYKYIMYSTYTHTYVYIYVHT